MAAKRHKRRKKTNHDSMSVFLNRDFILLRAFCASLRPLKTLSRPSSKGARSLLSLSSGTGGERGERGKIKNKEERI
jgi:hypothetical protein